VVNAASTASPAASEVTLQASSFRAASFSGPIPPPALLKQYDEISPGFADRILSQAESQSKHRQDLERHHLESGTKAELRGQIMAFVLAAGTILGGMYLILQDKEVLGGAAIIAAIASLAGVFVYGKKQQREELVRKTSQIPDAGKIAGSSQKQIPEPSSSD
jgi:uncharacterized membrane protein